MFKNFSFRRQLVTSNILEENEFNELIRKYRLEFNSNCIFYGINVMDQVILGTPIHVVFNLDLTIKQLSVFSDLGHLQIGMISVFCESRLYLLRVLDNKAADLFYNQKYHEMKFEPEGRINRQAEHALAYLSRFNVHNPLVVDYGAGDSDLSRVLETKIKRYIKLDPKLGHSDHYISQVVSNLGNDAIIMLRNVSHHIDNFDILNYSSANNILIIDWFGYNMAYGSIYHWVYKEECLFRDVSVLRRKLHCYQSIQLVDFDEGIHPSACLFRKQRSVYPISSFDMNDFRYDIQFMNDDCSLKPLDASALEYSPGMLRGVQDVFYPQRFDSMFNDLVPVGASNIQKASNLATKVHLIKEFVAHNREVRADDIFMWINIIEYASSKVIIDPFSGWFSRGIAFAIIHWFDADAVFQWYDIDEGKVDSTVKLIKYLKSSGCMCEFIYIETYCASREAIVITSPFYMNYESVGSINNKFTNVDSWARYVLYFMKIKAPFTNVSYIMVSDYKGDNMLSKLSKMVGDSSIYSVVNDIGYFKATVNVLYSTGKKEFNGALFNNVRNSELYQEFIVLGEKMKIMEKCMIKFSNYTVCGHLATPSFYSEQFDWHCGQLKLAYLLMDFVSQYDLDAVIYLGSGTPASVLTNNCINILAPLVKFVLVDRYYNIPSKLKHNNIIIINDFATLDNISDICDQVRGFKKIGVLSDIRKDSDVDTRGSDFEAEMILYQAVKNIISWSKVIFCLKVNYCPRVYNIPIGNLKYYPFISSELRLLTDLESGSMELDNVKFYDVLKQGINNCFLEDELCAGCQIIQSLEAFM